MDSSWNTSLLSALRLFLDEREDFLADRVEIVENNLVTVLEVPPGSGRRFGRVVDLTWLRSQFVPDNASGVADAWFLTIYPPDDWDKQNVVDGICWHAGKPA